MKQKNIYLLLDLTRYFLVYFILSSFVLADSFEIDLEEAKQDFVLETQRIQIPNFPHAFNAAIVQWQGLFLLSFRNIPNPKSPFESNIGLVWLDENFCPAGEPQLLNLRPFSTIPSRAEDARLIVVGEKLYMVYSDNAEPKISKGGYRVYLCELTYANNHFFIKNIECLSTFEGESKNVREKNWVPFVYQENLLLAYSLSPHRIFQPYFGRGRCETLYSTSTPLHWVWGEIRGGTPALLINESSYLSFFHSSIPMSSIHSEGKKITHYFIGAYLFSSQPPFAITHMGPGPIIGENFYRGEIYKPYWKQIRAVFPCGFIQNDQYIWIAYGRQDHEVWIVKLDKQKLIDYLLPINVNKQ